MSKSKTKTRTKTKSGRELEPERMTRGSERSRQFFRFFFNLFGPSRDSSESDA